MKRNCIVLLLVALMFGVAQAALVHQYHFEDGTANDSVGTAHGTAESGALIVGGQALLGGAGEFVNLPGPEIAINTFSEVTLELWSTQPEIDQGYSMTAAFGGTQDWWGKRYIAICTTRGDQVSRAMMTADNDNPGYESEVAVNGPEMNDGLQHHYVLALGVNPCICTDKPVLTFYIDGELWGAMNIGDRQLSAMSNDFAYLGKGLYPGDASVQCTINEFNIYDNALSCDEVKANYAAGPIPEPTTIALLGLGSLALLRSRKS